MQEEILDRKLERKKTSEAIDRFEEARSAERRAAALRAIRNPEQSSSLYFPIELIPEGVEYAWIRHTVYNEPDRNHQINSAKKGWVPVPAERHPEFVPVDYTNTQTHRNNFICVSGLVLSEREKCLCEEEREVANRNNYSLLSAMPSLHTAMGDPHMPVTPTYRNEYPGY